MVGDAGSETCNPKWRRVWQLHGHRRAGEGMSAFPAGWGFAGDPTVILPAPKSGTQLQAEQFDDKLAIARALIAVRERTLPEVQDATGWTYSATERVLTRLQGQGRITRHMAAGRREWVYCA